MEHRAFAAVYDRMTAAAEAAGLGRRRAELLARATGRVLEVGGGTGHNLAFYVNAADVTILEPDDAMRRRLEPRLVTCPAPARVVAAGIDEADLPEHGFDTVVCTLVLCTVPDPAAAAARIRRLLAPGGRLLFLEHVRAPGAQGLLQAGLTPLWRRVVPGCHLDREPVTALRAAGLLVADYDRVTLPLGPLASSGVQGVAVEPAAEPLAPPGTYPLPSPGPARRLLARVGGR